MLAMVERIATLEHDLFHVQYGPIGAQWISDEALTALAQASAETGRRMHMHLLETQRQREWADGAYPGGLINFLDEIGFLSPRLTVAHGVWLTPRECELLAKRGVTLAVNLSSNLRLRSGLPPVQTFRNAGLCFGIGLDASSFDDDEDMLREIRLVWRNYRGFGDTDILDRRDVFDAALMHGRRTVVGHDGGGGLAVGAPADIMVLDLVGDERGFRLFGLRYR
jgi:cytosine/adenosine deaminase-related metal-dependent hydrolase